MSFWPTKNSIEIVITPFVKFCRLQLSNILIFGLYRTDGVGSNEFCPIDECSVTIQILLANMFIFILHYFLFNWSIFIMHYFSQ